MGRGTFIGHNPEWEGEVSRASGGKAGAPYRHSETLIMLAAAFRAGIGVQYRQPEGAVGRMIGESKTPSFSQLRKRAGKPSADADQDGMITASDREQPRDDTGGRRDRTQAAQQGRVDGQKAEGETRFCKAAHVMVCTQTAGAACGMLLTRWPGMGGSGPENSSQETGPFPATLPGHITLTGPAHVRSSSP